MVHLKNYSDTEDIFQTVFLKYVLHSQTFESEEHEKAWIIRGDDQCLQRSFKKLFSGENRTFGAGGGNCREIPRGSGI